ARSSRIGEKNFADVSAMQITDRRGGLRGLHKLSVAPLLGSLQHTLDSFVEIGLGYLSLDRPAGSLSGGEAQRVKMSRHLGSALTDVTYVFGEPSIGLNPPDSERMKGTQLIPRDKANTAPAADRQTAPIAPAS